MGDATETSLSSMGRSWDTLVGGKNVNRRPKMTPSTYPSRCHPPLITQLRIKNMVAGMIKVVCGTITGVVSLINIVTMLYALMHSNSLQDGNPPTYLISIISWNANGLIFRAMYLMAFPVVEYSRQGYKIRQVFG